MKTIAALIILLMPALCSASNPAIYELAKAGESIANSQAEKIAAQENFIVMQAASHSRQREDWKKSDAEKAKRIAELESQRGRAPALIGLSVSSLIVAGGIACTVLGMHTTGLKVIAGGIVGASLSFAALYYAPQLALVGLGVAALAVLGMAIIIVIDLRKKHDAATELANGIAQANNIGGISAEGLRLIKQALDPIASKQLDREMK